MPKVQIEIDLPNSCGDCPCGHFQDAYSWCGLRYIYDKENEIDQYCLRGMPEWCPLHDKYKQDEETAKKAAKTIAGYLADYATLPLWNNPKAKQAFDDWMEKLEKDDNV